MASSQPQLGQENPHDGHDAPLTESSPPGTRLPRTYVGLTPSRTPTPTVEEHPSPTVDDFIAQPNTTASLDREHKMCIADTNTYRDIYVVGDGDIRTGFSFFARQCWKILSHGMIPVFIAIGVFVCSISWYLLVVGLLTLVPYRHYVLVSNRGDPLKASPHRELSDVPHYVLIVCGSGGHTREMLKMIERSIRPESLSHRRWAIGYDDKLSYEKVMEFERILAKRFVDLNMNPGTFDIKYFHRGRAVHQSWLTTPFTALHGFVDITEMLITAPHRSIPGFIYPAVIVSDGPGSGFLALLAAHLLKLFGIIPEDYMRAIFIESWARVNSLSLSGKLIQLFKLADVFIVQYRDLARRFGQTYTGNMVVMPTAPHIRLPRHIYSPKAIRKYLRSLEQLEGDSPNKRPLD
ncbi:glycosyltransferase family 1 protein [Hypoxylon crocopeplum]|nr:glycosyltransferase family 1 protein [Hypoxylon crocopeplum]